MSARLSPRARRGVTALLIVLIACALLLAPMILHGGDADAPAPLMSETAAIELPSPSASRPSMSPGLPRPATETPRAIEEIDPVRLHGASSTSGAVQDGTDAASDWSSYGTPDPLVDLLAQNPLLAQGIALPPPACMDCASSPRPSLFFPSPVLYGLVSGSGAGVGGGAAGSGALLPLIASDLDTATTQGKGTSDAVSAPHGRSGHSPDNSTGHGPDNSTEHGPDNSTEHGRDTSTDDPPANWPTGPAHPSGTYGPGHPGDLTGVGEPGAPVQQVPGPSSLIIAGAGALSFMIRAHFARKKRA